MTKEFKTTDVKDILVHPEINRYETGDKVLILNNVKFIVVEKTVIKSNHQPEGLYIEANSIIDYIARNLFGHDKNKYGITEKVKE